MISSSFRCCKRQLGLTPVLSNVATRIALSAGTFPSKEASSLSSSTIAMVVARHIHQFAEQHQQQSRCHVTYFLSSNVGNQQTRRMWKTPLSTDAATQPSTPDETTSDSAVEEEEESMKKREIIWTTDRLTKEQIAKVDAIFHKILWLDMFETSMLTALINERLGLKLTPKQRLKFERQIEAVAAARLGGAAGAGGDKSETEDEAQDTGPKTLGVKLVAFDSKTKIKIIKEVRALVPGLGLKEAKELVESAPAVIQKDLKPEQAEEIKTKLQDLGATIEVV